MSLFSNQDLFAFELVDEWAITYSADQRGLR